MALRILVVDDDPVTVSIVRQILESVGHQVSVLCSGFGFTVTLRDFDPDVVLLDVNMPGLGGEGALRSAHQFGGQLTRQPKILLHSGTEGDELRRLAEKLGADGYVQKPASRQTLIEAVEAAPSQQKPTAASPR